MAHIDAGKTTTTERILYYTGKTHKIGEVHEGAATMDWMVQEQERGVTITSAATTCFWNKDGKDYRIRSSTPRATLTSPPRSSAACASSMALSPSSTPSLAFSPSLRPFGVRLPPSTSPHRLHQQIMTAWADFFNAIETMKDRLDANAVAAQVPMGAEDNFWGVIDLVTMTAWDFKADEKGMTYPEPMDEIPAEFADIAATKREELLDAAASFDDELMEKILMEEDFTVEELKGCSAQGRFGQRTQSSSWVPPTRTRAFRSCSTLSSTTCPARLTSRPSPVPIRTPARRSSVILPSTSLSPAWSSRS